MGHRNVLPLDQAESEDQDIPRHIEECRPDTDLGGDDLLPPAQMAESLHQLQGITDGYGAETLKGMFASVTAVRGVVLLGEGTQTVTQSKRGTADVYILMGRHWVLVLNQVLVLVLNQVLVLANQRQKNYKNMIRLLSC